MSHTTADARSAVRPGGQSSTLTRTVIAVAVIVILALFIALIFSAPNDNASPRSLGFSLNSFFIWLGGLAPLAQIPIILVVFAAVVGIILVLIEFAPRPGRGYFILRLVACIAIPTAAYC